MRHAMTKADKVRAYVSSVPWDNTPLMGHIAMKFNILESYVRKICNEPFNCSRLDQKWSKRMKKDLLRGEMVGGCQYLSFTKSGDHVDVILERGDGMVARCDAHTFLVVNWRNYYNVEYS